MSITDTVRDEGLDYVATNGDRFDICSQDPGTYAEATSTYTLGNKAVTCTGPVDGSSGGRAVTIPAITDGSVTSTGTATHWALTNGTDEIYATGAVSPSFGVTSGSTFGTNAVEIVIED